MTGAAALAFLRGFAAPHRRLLLLGTLLMLAESLAGLAVPWFGGLLAGVVLGSDSSAQGVLAGLLLLFAAQAVSKAGSSFFLDEAADRIVADLRTRLYDHLQALPIAFYHRRRLGDMLALLTTDVYVVSGYISTVVTSALPLSVTAVGAAILMFSIRIELALLTLVLVPLFYLMLKLAGRQLRPLGLRLQGEEARAIARAHETLSLLPAIKVFTREARESTRFRVQLDRILRLSRDQRLVVASFGPLMQFVAIAGMLGLFALVSADLAGGHLDPPSLVALVLYAQLLSRPIAGLADLYGQSQAARGALVRVHEALAEPAEDSSPSAKRFPPVQGAVEFHDVHFSYEGRGAALRGIDLRIEAGETVALVGPNGAGKSTVAHLMLRLHAPTRGRLTIDGIDVASVSLASLREQIGIVPQHVLLFNASVRDNIAYGRLEATPEDIRAAASAAGAHDFISNLPQGYDTLIGDRGMRLSGGEQQRIALARALLKNPPILILDEATSMFDPAAEHDFLRACKDSLRARTVIMITHRPASLAVADRIVHMSGGRILSMSSNACS